MKWVCFGVAAIFLIVTAFYCLTGEITKSIWWGTLSILNWISAIAYRLEELIKESK